MNSIVRLSLIIFFLNKVLTGPMNSARDPLENHNFAFSSCTGLTMHVKRSSQRIKKNNKKINADGILFSTIQMKASLLWQWAKSKACCYMDAI